MSLGEKIKACRKDKNLSQENLAEKVGVSRQAVTKWESNKSSPSTENLILIGQILDVSIKDLTSDTPISKINKTVNQIDSNKKQFYYNEARIKIISFIACILLTPINILIYNKGLYGLVDLDIIFLIKEFFKGTMFDLIYILILGFSLIQFILKLKNNENTKVFISDNFIKNTRKEHIFVAAFLFPLMLIVTFVFLKPFTPIVMFLNVLVTSYIVIFNSLRELTKKEVSL